MAEESAGGGFPAQGREEQELVTFRLNRGGISAYEALKASKMDTDSVVLAGLVNAALNLNQSRPPVAEKSLGGNFQAAGGEAQELVAFRLNKVGVQVYETLKAAGIDTDAVVHDGLVTAVLNLNRTRRWAESQKGEEKGSDGLLR